VTNINIKGKIICE